MSCEMRLEKLDEGRIGKDRESRVQAMLGESQTTSDLVNEVERGISSRGGNKMEMSLCGQTVELQMQE